MEPYLLFLVAIPPYPFFQNLARPAESREEAMKVAEQEISANPYFVVAVALTQTSYAGDVANVRPFFFLVLASNGLVVASRLGAGGDEVAILRFFILRFFLGSARRIFTILFNFFSLG